MYYCALEITEKKNILMRFTLWLQFRFQHKKTQYVDLRLELQLFSNAQLMCEACVCVRTWNAWISTERTRFQLKRMLVMHIVWCVWKYAMYMYAWTIIILCGVETWLNYMHHYKGGTL